ncbi:MAG: nuclear transport factor 2 family protein [Gammaproteobacteria bacterium]|nr:nuclear transport factor 2 family protein [Gammaproteobacteria bacterium]
MRTMILVLMTALASTVAADDSVKGARATLDNYFDAFNSGDLQRVANEIYSTPLHQGLGTEHNVLATPEDALQQLTGFHKGISAQGWVEFRFENVESCVLTEDLVLLDTQYASVFKKGPESFETMTTMLYVLQRNEGSWKIISYYRHDGDTRPTCS